MKLSFQQQLAGIGIVCVIVTLLSAVIRPNGFHAHRYPEFIDVVTLAEKIKTREGLTIIDIRSPIDYKQFHIPSAVNVQLTEFLSQDWGNQDLIIYSGDDNLARKLWMDLPVEIKSNTKIVYGGIHDWYDRVLYPSLPVKANPEDSLLVESINLISLFYGGQPEFQMDVPMEYYRQDFSQVQWPTVERKGTLVRKGC